VIRDILIHESGLRSWIPFYEETLPYSIYHNTYTSTPDAAHSIEVAKNMYMRDTQIDQMWRTIYNSPLPNKGEYKYSDVGYYFFKKIIEEKYAYKSLDEHVQERFYKPLGLTTMTYKPSRKFSTYSIPPTENDVKWRKQIVQGYVHDMGAAMMDGVGGHAGLFSNANDLAVIMHMLINGGNYGARSYVNENTIKTFTAAQKKGSRRALGFDRPEHNTRYKTPASRKSSRNTFGHTGFTGTCAWADPNNGLVYIFLSNRTYPKMNNYKLIKNNVRTKIHDAIYDAIALAKARGAISG
jgi:CubicO group peptidase (beta-lactamase class C family)